MKMLLVVAGLLVGVNAWADDEVYSWNSSESAYTDQANASTVFNGTSVENLQIYSTQFRDWGSNDGTVKINSGGKISFYKFDLSTIKSKLTNEGGTITGVTFSFTGHTADGKACSKIRALGYNAEWSASTLTNSNVSNSVGTITGLVTSTGSFQPLDNTAELSVGSETTLEVNAKTYVQSAIDEDKDYVSFAITANYTRAGLLNTSATLTVTYSVVAQAEYTINYQLNGTTVASETHSADIGSTVNAQSSIWNEGNTQKYFVDDETTSFTIANSGNEFNVAVREAENWTYYVKAYYGSTELMTISTNTVIEGESASYGYPQYIAVEGVLYKSTVQSGNPWWGESYTMTENNSTRGFQYVPEGNESIVFCSEAEDIPGLNVVSGGNTDIRASNRKGAYATEETAITTLEPGIYRVFAATYGNSGTTFTLKAGNATVFTITTAGNPKHTTGDPFLVTETTDLVLLPAGNGGTSPKSMDYIIVQKAGEYYESMSIVGDFSENEWDATKGIAMTRSAENPYEWTAVVEDYTITSAKYYYEYKAVGNGDYDVYQLPGSGNQNYNFNYDGAREGVYTLTFTVNTQDHTVGLAIEKQPTAIIYFVNTNDWAAENIKAWVWDENNGDYNYTGGTWPGQTMTATGEQIDGKDVYSWSTYVLNPTPTTLIISNNGSNSERTGNQAFVNGKTYKADGSVLTVAKTISAAGYATICSAYALDFAGTGLTAYIAKEAEDNNVEFEAVTTIPANTGVLLKGDKGDYTISVIPSSSTDVSANLFVGVLENTEVAAETAFVLMASPEVGFYKNHKAFTVGANTAYIPADVAPARSFIGFDEDSQTTGIQNLTPAKDKGVVYNLNGQRVAAPQRGLYIVGGKKVVMK